MRKLRKKQEEIMSTYRSDRRLLPHVRDLYQVRSGIDRRGESLDQTKIKHTKEPGRRYDASFTVIARSGAKRFRLNCVDISQSGILLKADSEDAYYRLSMVENPTLSFRIPPGIMEEGMENKALKINVTQSRKLPGENAVAYQFEQGLSTYFRYRETALAVFSFGMIFIISILVLLMRSESIFYLRFNKITAVYSLITAVFLLTRYLFGSFYRSVPIDPDYTPGVTIVIPCFNEEEWIERTIICCLDQDYPIDKLEVIIVDDHSTDRSVEVIKKTLDSLQEKGDMFDITNRLSLLLQEKNDGKRHAMARGIKESKHELVVVVDSDSFLDPDAIRHLVQPFKDEKMAGVSGRTDVANTFTNHLTKMQSVRYYVAFRVMKAAESLFDSVTCLSGPLSCYRKSFLLEYMDDWLNQKFFGNKATFGDDRSMTNFMLREHRTSYQDTAVAFTIVPSGYKMFLRQQMRWKRSWLRESFIASLFIWKKEPFMSASFYFGMLITIVSPIIVLYNVVYVPLVYHQFPLVFAIGLILMSFMMSFAHKFFRKSMTWLHGLWFNFFYVTVLIWQMPIAWVTFWKSNWGTRETPADVKGRKKALKEQPRNERYEW